MNVKIMEKAKENYICEGYKRLANIEATRNWAKLGTNEPKLCKYVKPKVEKNKAGWKNFVNMVMQLKP